MLPTGLHGQTHLGSFICREWELRITARCLAEDLGTTGDADFEELLRIEIVKTFVKDRGERVHDTRQVAPLTCGREVWVLARGHDHRGATWHDEENRVVWLLAYGLHRSGRSDDFFPRCKRLDADGRLLPTDADYERLVRDRDKRFAFAIRIEAPLVLRDARRASGEHRFMLGGEFGICVAVEVVEELEAITVAFRVDSTHIDLVPIVLAAMQPGEWEPATRMPSRRLDPMECAFELVRDRD